jgi:hypothetical protein
MEGKTAGPSAFGVVLKSSTRYMIPEQKLTGFPFV